MGQPGGVMINRVGYSNFWLNNYLNVNKNALGLMNLTLISQIVRNFLIFSHIQSNSYFTNDKFDDYSLKTSNNFKYYRKTEAHHRHTKHRETFFTRSNLSGYLGSSVKIYRLDRWLIINWVVFRDFFKNSLRDSSLLVGVDGRKFSYKLNRLKKFEKILFLKKTYITKINGSVGLKNKRLFF